MAASLTDSIPGDTLHSRAALRGLSGSAGQAAIRDGRLLLSGDDTGATQPLVYLDDLRVAWFSDWSRLERTLEKAGLLRVDPGGCQFLLAYGLVPPPYTLYADVYALGPGDRLEIDLARDAARYRVEFPYFEERSRGDEVFDVERLKRLLASAVERALPAGAPAAIMQSSGKDSAGLLIGLAECGRTDVRAVTYDSPQREHEGPIAAGLASRFGLSHTIVQPEPDEECQALLDFAERSPSIVADVALLAYLPALRRLGVDGGVVLDGLGNDAYMGYVQPRRDAWLCALSLPRRFPSLWGRWEVPDLGAHASYLAKSMLMYPAERSLAGSRLAPVSARRLIPGRTPLESYFPDLDARLRDRSEVDFRAFVRGRIFDGCGTMPKGRLAAARHGAQAVFPYCDPELIDYCFHLPQPDRYDARRRINKIALRRLLEREIGDSPYLRAKGSFRFDVLRFVEVNEGTIRRELAAARSLFGDLEGRSEFLLRRRTNYVHAYALLTLFVAAAWLSRRPPRVTAPLADRSGHRPAASLTENGP